MPFAVLSKKAEEPQTTTKRPMIKWPNRVKVRKTFGIWFYGIAFLVSGLIVSIILAALVRNIMTIAKVLGVASIPLSKIILTAVVSVMVLFLLSLSILILFRKKRGLILAMCSLLTLWGMLGKICCVYFMPLNQVFSGPDSAFELLFLVSALIFFMRPKIKDHFRYTTEQMGTLTM